MHAPLTCEVEYFAPEPYDDAEWRISGRVTGGLVAIAHGHIAYQGTCIAPLTCGCPSGDKPSISSPRDGFRGHFFFPLALPSGTHELELVFLDAAGTEAGRAPLPLALSRSVAPRPAPAKVTADLQHAQAPYLTLLAKTLLALPYMATSELALRMDGRDWPDFAHSMVGMERLSHVRACAETAIRENVPGDLMETGVWRGGTCIMLRGVLQALGDRTRRVWVADSFEGLPPPNPEKYPADLGDTLFEFKELAVSLEEVQANFRKYDLLDDQVRFVKGFFSQSLPGAPVERLALLRLDGDMYESTMDALHALYPKLSPGGFCIVDDYGAIAACRQAVHDYRRAHGITEPIGMIDWTGAWWRRD